MASPLFSKPLWHLVDAKNQVVGRLATQICHILRGKHKPSYVPHYDCGDYVVVVNAQDVRFTGNKVEQKKYIWHTGYPGGIKSKTVKEQLQHKPEEVTHSLTHSSTHSLTHSITHSTTHSLRCCAKLYSVCYQRINYALGMPES